MTNPPPLRLSICIPAYNRGPYLAELFESILSQEGHDCEVEVVVSDNASTDETAEVIAAWRDRFDRFVYDRAPENLGADRNFLRVVELASGDYCWLMGSDDRLEPGAVAAIAAAVRDHPGVAGLSVNRRAYTYALDARIYERPVAGGALPDSREIVGAEAIFCLLGDYFGYLSGQVVHRGLWDRVVARGGLEPYFNAYVHIYVIGRMVQIEPRWFYLAQACVGWRSANDSFLSQGEFRRMAIDVVGYERITRDLFGPGSHAYREVNRTVGSVHVRYAVMGAKLRGVDGAFFRQAGPLLVANYWRYAAFWTRTAPLFLVPGGAMRGLRWAYRRTLKPWRVRRLAR